LCQRNRLKRVPLCFHHRASVGKETCANWTGCCLPRRPSIATSGREGEGGSRVRSESLISISYRQNPLHPWPRPRPPCCQLRLWLVDQFQRCSPGEHEPGWLHMITVGSLIAERNCQIVSRLCWDQIPSFFSLTKKMAAFGEGPGSLFNIMQTIWGNTRFKKWMGTTLYARADHTIAG